MPEVDGRPLPDHSRALGGGNGGQARVFGEGHGRQVLRRQPVPGRDVAGDGQDVDAVTGSGHDHGAPERADQRDQHEQHGRGPASARSLLRAGAGREVAGPGIESRGE